MLKDYKKVNVRNENNVYGKIVGYLRVSTNQQEVIIQRDTISEYCRQKGFDLNRLLFIELVMSSRRTPKERMHNQLLSLKKGDIVIASEITRLGRSTAEITQLTNAILNNGVRLILIKQKLDLDATNRHDIGSKLILNIFSVMAELERDLISLRTKEALAYKKKQGMILGKPKGTVQKSIYDSKLELIEELLKKKIAISVISKLIGVGHHASLRKYLLRKKIV